MATTQSAPQPAHQLAPAPTATLPRLRSNHGACLDPAQVGRMRSSTMDTPLPELRRRFATDGYIWMRHILPREDVLDMREHYFTHLAPTGILEPGTSPREAIFNSAEDPLQHLGIGATDLPSDLQRVRLLTEAHASELYQKFLAHPAFRKFVREFMGWERELLIQRNMLRHNVPKGVSTGLHYDKLFLRAGDAEFLTAWVPIGDCAADGGGLTYLEGSAGLGRQMEDQFMERAKEMSRKERLSAFNTNMARDGQLGHDLETFGREKCEEHAAYKGMSRRWLVGDYEAGDIVFHNPYMIHGSAKNEDKLGRIRLSSDIRFYEEGAAIDERWMKLWTPDDGL